MNILPNPDWRKERESMSDRKKAAKTKPFKKAKSASDRMQEKSSAAPPNKHPARKSGKKRLAFLIFIVLVVAAGGVTAAAKFGGTTFTGISADIKGFFSSFGNGGGYPYNLSDSTIISAGKIGSGIMVLDNDSLSILNATAKEIAGVQHTFPNPATNTSNGRVVLFDRASGRFKVISPSGILFEKDMERNILAAALGKKGNVAVAAKSLNAQSDLTVFDKNKKEIFAWECANERISAVALSANGKSAAAAVIGANNAEIYSKVFVFDFDKNEPVAVFDYPATALIDLKFGSGNTLIAAGDNSISVISLDSGTKQDYSFGTGQLNCLYVHENGKTAVVLSAFGNELKNDLRVYSAKGALIFEKSFDQAVRRVSCDENYVSILFDNEVQTFNEKGRQMGSVTADKYTERIISAGKNTYLIEKSSIAKHSAVGMNNS